MDAGGEGSSPPPYVRIATSMLPLMAAVSTRFNMYAGGDSNSSRRNIRARACWSQCLGIWRSGLMRINWRTAGGRTGGIAAGLVLLAALAVLLPSSGRPASAGAAVSDPAD